MIRLTRRAERDSKRIGPGPPRERIIEGLHQLEAGAENFDVKALEGRTPWRRLRIGEYRVLFRPDGGDWLVDRIVSRGELQEAARSLE